MRLWYFEKIVLTQVNLTTLMVQSWFKTSPGLLSCYTEFRLDIKIRMILITRLVLLYAQPFMEAQDES